MKKNLFTVVAFILVAFASQAQTTNRNAVKMNPVSLLVKTGNIAYERAVSPKTSVQLGAFYSGVGLNDFKYAGWGVTPEVRFYMDRQAKALNGVYMAPFVRYQNFAIRDEELKSKARFTSVGGGAILGWQRAWSSGFTLDLFAGPSVSKLSFKDDGDEDDFEVSGGFKGFGLRTGITVGFSF
jgi:hypothetical protein